MYGKRWKSKQQTREKRTEKVLSGRLRMLATDTLAGRQVEGQEGHQDRTEVGGALKSRQSGRWRLVRKRHGMGSN